MKRLFLSVLLAASVIVAPLAHADTGYVPVGDPYTDTIGLWSDLASALSSLANDFAVIFDGHEFATRSTGGTPEQPASAATAAVSFASAVPTTNRATSSPPASQPRATPTVINYTTNPIERIVDEEPLASNTFVTQSELAQVLVALSNSPSTKSASTTVPTVPFADGNPLIPYAAENNITNLSNVTISNATISGGSVPSSSLTGTITNAIETATGEIDSLTGTALTYTNGTTTNATSTNLFASNLAAAVLAVSGTSTLTHLNLSTLNCSTFGNGGKLTTDALGNVTCAADQGGSGSTVGGADTQVQYNSGGSFTGSSAFTFASSPALLTVSNASTTNVTANYSSSTNLVAGNATSTNFFAANASTTNATSTNLFASLANFTTGVINALSGAQLTYTAASTTNLSASGEGYFGTASTTNLTLSGAPSGFLQTNAQGAVSATSTFSAGSLFGTLASINGTALPANGAITVAAASSTILGDNNAFSGVDNFTNVSGNFAGTWQTFSPSHFQSAGTYLTGIGNYATTTAAAISISTSTQTFNGLTFGNSFAVSPIGITVTPAISGTLNNAGLSHSTIVVNGTTFTLGDAADTVTAASSTLLGDNNAFSGVDTFKVVNLSATSSSLLGVNASGEVVATSSIGTNLLAGALGTINGTPFSAGGSITVGSASTTLLGDNNSFGGSNAFSSLLKLLGGLLSGASSTIGNGTQAGGLTVNGGATTTQNLIVQGAGTSTFAGNIGISGNIVPSADNTYMLGTPTDEWKDVYIGPGSLFVNGQEVVHTDASQNVVLTANSNQNLETQTSGSGSILLNSSGTGNIQLAGPVQITGGDAFTTSNGSPVIFTNGVEPGNLELTGNAIQATNTNGGISFSPNGNGSTYFTNGNVGIGTTSPLATLTVSDNTTNADTSAFAVSSSTASATTTLFSISNTGAITTSLGSGFVGSSNGQLYTFASSSINAASSTLLANNNTWTGLQNFSNATSTLFTATTAWVGTLNLTNALTVGNGGTGINSTPSYGQLLVGNGTNYTLTATSSLGLPTFASIASAYPFRGTGNSTSTITQFNAGLTAYATSTIGNGTQAGGLTISGGATTTGNAYFANNVGIGTTSPFSLLSVSGSSAWAGNIGGVNFTDSGTVGSGLTLTSTGSGGRTWSILSTASGASPGAGKFVILDSTAGTARFVIDSFGDVGIGTTSPFSLLSVSGSSAWAGNIGGVNFTDSGTVGSGLTLTSTGSGGRTWSILSTASGASPGAGKFVILDSTAGTARFVIDSFGDVGIGTTTPANYLGSSLTVQGGLLVGGNSSTGGATNGAVASMHLAYLGGGAQYGVVMHPAADGAYSLLQLNAAGSTVGGIINSSSATSFLTTSDRRLKENIATTTQGLATLMQIPVDNFDFINDSTHTQVQGFIAQSLYPIYPEAVTTNGDNGIVPLGPTSTPWEVDYGRITPLIVSAIQDIANISSTFEQNLIAWLGSASNGIAHLFAGQVDTQELCLNSSSNDPSPVCVTKTQLAALLSQTASAQTSESVSSSAPQNPTSEIPESVSSTTPPVIQINGDNPAIVVVGDTYNDLGVAITGPTADLNLGIQTFVNGVAVNPVQIDTSQAATDTVQYVATDQNGLTSTSTRTVIIEAPPIVPLDVASSSLPTTTATSTDATSSEQSPALAPPL